jgi:hypothetical protein
LTIKGQAKKTFELNLSDCTWFSNWDEPQFIRNGIGGVRGAGHIMDVDLLKKDVYKDEIYCKEVIQVRLFIPKRWILSFERKEKFFFLFQP